MHAMGGSMPLRGRQTRAGIGRIVSFREHCGCGQALRNDDLLERCEPMMVVRLTGIGITAGLSASDLVCQRGRPFGPREDAAFVKGQHNRESLRFPGFAKDGTALVTREARHSFRRRALGFSVSRSRGLQIGLEGI
jgi:hypothetical protein